MRSDDGDLFSAALADALGCESTREGARIVLDAVLPSVGADAGRVLFLNLRTGHFDQHAQIGHDAQDTIDPVPAAGMAGGEAIPTADIAQIAAKTGRVECWNRHRRSAPSRWHEPIANHRAIVPIRRFDTVVALLDLEGPSEFSVDTLIDSDSLLGQVLIKVYERRFTLRLLQELQQPVEASRKRPDFFDKLAELISLSTGMEFVAIREYDPDSELLQCVAALGLGVERGEYEEIDLPDLEKVPSFDRALHGETVVEPIMSADHLAALREMEHLKDVRSFVAMPIIVGNAVTGVLSVAARCPYEFSQIELRGFETVANSIGVGIANFKNLHANTREIRQIAEEAAGQLSDLLAQAGRHKAKLHLDNAQKRLYLLQQGLEGKGKDIDVVAEIRGVSTDQAQIRTSLDRMKTDNLIRPDQSPQRTDIRKLVNSATDQVAGELDANEISVASPGAGYIQVIPEAVTLAFLYLLQNSIFAFQDSRAKRRNREIKITVAARQSGSEMVRVNFEDNATGIDPTRLRMPAELRELPWQEAIFERHVSGTGGTGFGLYMVRTLVEMSGGGAPAAIKLLEYKSRVVFGLELPAAD